MFTGVIESTGKIVKLNRNSTNIDITVQPEMPEFLDGVKQGDSIAVDGVCLTVTALTEIEFTAFISTETFNVTNFKYKKVTGVVNLEKALSVNSRLDGHFVQGHIDDTAKFLSLKKILNDYELTLQLPETLRKYTVKKGSISVNGVSLTISDVVGANIKVAVIPETFNRTSFRFLKSGELVNIETDILAKYVENFLSRK